MTEPTPHRFATAYIAALPITELFVDSTYQRECDEPRAARIAATWDPRLLGVIDVSDRGEVSMPRYAIINGQHRFRAAQKICGVGPFYLAANVHTGLSVTDEASLFDEIDRKTKKLTTWDRWRARRAAGEQLVLDVERIAAMHGLTVAPHSAPANLRCVASLESIIRREAGEPLLSETLDLIIDAWGRTVDTFEAAIVSGTALVLETFQDVPAFDQVRLADAMSEVTPRQVKSQGQSLREFESGSLTRMVAITLVRLYNRQRGANLVESDL